jgi:hypothetical protein
MQPTDVPFTVWFPLELINEAMIVAMERVGLEPDPNNLPTDGYIYIAAILKDEAARARRGHSEAINRAGERASGRRPSRARAIADRASDDTVKRRIG